MATEWARGPSRPLKARSLHLAVRLSGTSSGQAGGHESQAREWVHRGLQQHAGWSPSVGGGPPVASGSASSLSFQLMLASGPRTKGGCLASTRTLHDWLSYAAKSSAKSTTSQSDGDNERTSHWRQAQSSPALKRDPVAETEF